MTILHVLYFLGILGFELRFDVLICRQDLIHIFVSLFLCIQKAQLSSIDLVFQALNLLLKISIFTAQETLILVEQINLTSQTFITSFNIEFSFLESTVLKLELLLLASDGS